MKTNSKKSREFPHLFVILVSIILIVTILTYIVPAGTYERLIDENGRQVIDPTSFQYVAQTPVSPPAMLLCMVEGLIDAAGITVLIFCAYSSLYIIESTGAIDASIAWMVNKTEKNPKASTFIIIVLMFVLAVWSSTGTLSYEQIIAFIPIFITLSMALGYDALVGLGISYIPVGVGFASATVNPFSIGVAQDIAELPLFSGIKLRIVVLITMTLISIIYVLLYAKKVKNNPESSLVAEIDFQDFKMDEERFNTPFTFRRKATLAILFIGVGIMAYGLIKLGWYINEVSAVFLGIMLFTGLINKWKPNRLANTFVEGLSKAVLPAITVGVARGILMVINKGSILDTIINSAGTLLNKMSIYAGSIGMLILQTILNLFIPSGSGQAATTMPIMTPIADLIGMNRQIAVLIFQFGDGFSNLIWPTSFVLLACAIGKIPLNKYYKWFMPLFTIMVILQIVFIFIAINIGYGPF